MNQLSNNNSNQYLDPDDSVNQLVTETSYDFSNQIDSNQKPKTSYDDECVDYLETETSFEFSNLLIDADCKRETEKMMMTELMENDDSVDQLETETSFDFSNFRIDSNQKPETEKLMKKSPENDDSVDLSEAKMTSESHQMTSSSPEMIPQLTENDVYVDQLEAKINDGINQMMSASPELMPKANKDSNPQEMTSASPELILKSTENDDSVAETSFDFNPNDSNSQKMTSASLQMMSESKQMTSASPASESESDEDVEDDDDEEGEFTFMYVGDNNNINNDLYNTERFESGQIRFPLFDQTLLSTGDNRLPLSVPVDNVFIESPRRSNGETDGISSGTFCAISKDSESGSQEINIKSNSTGFSKLWRFRDNMNRSNSDGRDAFVFFQSPTGSSSNGKVNGVSVSQVEKDGATSSSNGKFNGVKLVDGKDNGKGKVTEKAVKKGKKKVKSAHEVYLKQKGGKTEDERRRSYLPYRPGLMGFFTNMNGGLSKNVHPF